MSSMLTVMVVCSALAGCVRDDPFSVPGPFLIELGEYTLDVAEDGSGYFNHTLIFTNTPGDVERVRAVVHPEIWNLNKVAGKRSGEIESGNRGLIVPSRPFPSEAVWQFYIVTRFEPGSLSEGGSVNHELTVGTAVGSTEHRWAYHYPCIDREGGRTDGKAFCGTWMHIREEPLGTMDELDPPSKRPRP